MASTNKYVSQAQSQLKGQYTTNKNNLQNNFNQNMNDLESQKGDINKQYDGYIDDAKLAGENNKASYNNSTLNRGLGRSSVATTGITGIQNQTDKNITSINNQRQSQMDNIAKLKDMLRNNLTNSLSSLESEYNSNVNSLAMQLQQRAEDVSYRNKQLAQSAAQAKADMAYKYAALKQSAAQAKAELAYKYAALKNSQSNKSSSNSSKSSSYPSQSDFKAQLQSMDTIYATTILAKNRSELIKQYGVSGYNSFLNAVKKSDAIGYEKYTDPILKYQAKYGN